MQLWILCSLPIIAALIGYVTNYLAVKMLFHPREKVKILFLEIQGIFPKRQEVLGERLGEVVARELVSIEDITAKIKEVSQSDAMTEAMDEHLEHLIRKKLPEMFPMMAMFLNDEMVEKIKGAFASELLQMTDQFTDKMSEDLKESLHIQSMVKDKVVQFSSEKLEAILFEIMKKEFQFIEILGGVLGFVIGSVQAGIVYFGN
jgi:uncharacterized membrane protein YheB (UPF0754 family)